uniref:UDP-glucuronic acid decarboxylase 1-like n=1 Tax=Rhizophora mucronata TaxID=61149 RepID=A0A2P2PL64_RHIMU
MDDNHEVNQRYNRLLALYILVSLFKALSLHLHSICGSGNHSP